MFLICSARSLWIFIEIIKRITGILDKNIIKDPFKILKNRSSSVIETDLERWYDYNEDLS